MLLLGSPRVQFACAAATDAVYARNESTRRLLAGNAQDDGSDQGQALRLALETFRKAVRSELLASHPSTSRGAAAPELTVQMRQ